VEAAIEAARRWGVHSAGSVALQGGTAPMLALEERLADMLGCREASVFPTGWAAGFGTIKALVRPGDHVIIDTLGHACLFEGAAAATRNVHRIAHRSTRAVERLLARIRATDAQCGILVVTETLFSMESTVPDIRAQQDLCRRYGATLLVDVAHDLGAIGDGGTGFLGDQAMLGEVDIVIGAFSKTFASNGGFAAYRAPGIKLALRSFATSLTFSNALSPVQAATVLAALDIIRSAEGAQRRRRLMANIQRLRTGLEARAFTLLGQPSAIVPVNLGSLSHARLMTRAVLARGALVNLVEHPAISRRSGRWRLQVMADHTEAHVDKMVAVAVAAREQLGDTPAPAEDAPEGVDEAP
jgi:glycine C-acetyltransferase